MKALRLYGKKDIRLEELPVPQICEGGLLVRVEVAALGDADLHLWKNGSAGVDESHPLTPGQEFAGTVEQVGRQTTGYEKGMRVVVAPATRSNGSDEGSLRGDGQLFGTTIDGGFAEYVAVPPQAVCQGNVTVLPDGVPYAAAVLAWPLACAYNGLLKCGAAPGDYAFVAGMGPVGLLYALLLKNAGATVIVCDRSFDRLVDAQRFVEGSVVFGGDDLPGFVQKQTNGHGLDIAVIAGGSSPMQADILPLMAHGGRMVYAAGHAKEQQPTQLDMDILCNRELMLTGVSGAPVALFHKALELIERSIVPVTRLITGEYHISEAALAFEEAEKDLKSIITF
ncbi:alcohol dehydrogenase catalytic domain-containing protein [Christensenellaceae bacterium OttesenSCG-928-K19]|nr:alcohol dehydrogenase catalytic domain-containing protein [Christensenellaceae bacterium OttesenSCG-928-K19]